MALRALSRALLLAGTSFVAACGGWPGSGPGCRPVSPPAPLPEELVESSGVAVSPGRPGRYWTLSDGGEPVLYAVDAAGELLGSVRLDVPKRDWEAMAVSDCGGAPCLWVADTGDNTARRTGVVVHRLREPDPAAGGTAPVESFPIRFPDGPRDVEAIFVLPGGRLHLISKGVHAPPSVYRYPGPLRTDTTVTVEEVQRLDEGPRALPRQITGASATPDGRFVAVRTYETLTFMAVRDGGLHPIDDGVVSLRTLREGQGEAVGLGPDGEVVLTSEAGPMGRRGSIVVLRCRLPGRAAGPGGDTLPLARTASPGHIALPARRG